MKITIAFASLLLMAAPSAHAAGTASETNRTYQPAINTGGMGGAANAADKSAGKQGQAQAMSMMVAGMMAAQCGPQNPAACAMAMLAAMQGASLGGTKAGANMSGANFATNYGSGGTDPKDKKDDPTKKGDTGAGATIDDVKQALAAKGATINPDGKTMALPNGKTVPLSSVTSEEGMKSAGFSDADISAAQASLSDAQLKAQEKIKTFAPEVPSGGGAPAGAGYAGGGGGGGGGSSYAMRPVGMQNRTKPNLSGLSKNLGNDKIGVAADNIFDMITRRYKAKDEIFLKH